MWAAKRRERSILTDQPKSTRHTIHTRHLHQGNQLTLVAAPTVAVDSIEPMDTAENDHVNPVDSVGSLEEAAAKRKQRLQQLKQLGESANNQQSDSKSASLPSPIFRSYHPSDATLKDLRLDKIKPATMEDDVKKVLQGSQSTTVKDDLDIVDLAPKTIDWDLKRIVKKDLDKLERRTQRAIAALIRERVKDQLQDAEDD